MAKRTTASKPARQLGELLQEQQEPFTLEVYLSERGCVRRKLSSGANFIGCHGNSSRFLKKFGSQNQSKKGIPSFPKVLKIVLSNKFFTIKGLRTKNSHNEDGKLTVTEMGRNNQETAEPDRFSSASSTTVYNSCSDSDLEEPPMFADNFKSNLKSFNEREKKAASDAKYQWSFMEDSKQHSPPSVLEEISSSTGSTLSRVKTARRVSSTRQKSFFLPKLITEDSILSASLWNLLVQTTQEKPSCAGLRELQAPDRHRSNSSAFSVSKWVLQQTKQLLFDCVRELAEKNHEREDEGKAGSVICKKMKGWEKRCGDVSNKRELLESDVMDFETEKSEIELIVGNAIVEEITSEVVMDMMMIQVL